MDKEAPSSDRLLRRRLSTASGYTVYSRLLVLHDGFISRPAKSSASYGQEPRPITSASRRPPTCSAPLSRQTTSIFAHPDLLGVDSVALHYCLDRETRTIHAHCT